MMITCVISTLKFLFYRLQNREDPFVSKYGLILLKAFHVIFTDIKRIITNFVHCRITFAINIYNFT